MLNVVIAAAVLQIVHGFVTVYDYNERCNYTDECIDHRMECVLDETNVKVCLCDRYHEWLNTTYGCVPKYNASAILKMFTANSNPDLSWQNETIFLGQKIAGFFVLVVCLLSFVIVGSYCFHMRKKDKALKEVVNRLQKRSMDRPFRQKIAISHI